jgi:hypothetical protein
MLSKRLAVLAEQGRAANEVWAVSFGIGRGRQSHVRQRPDCWSYPGSRIIRSSPSGASFFLARRVLWRLVGRGRDNSSSLPSQLT